jgi:hypothetical protein
MSDDPTILPAVEPLDEAGGRALVEAWRVSGLSGAAFCRQRHLRPQRLHYWRERLGYPIKVVREPSVAPVARPPSSEGFVQMVVRAAPGLPSHHVEVVVGGVVVRVGSGFDADLLRRVVGVLGAEA